MKLLEAAQENYLTHTDTRQYPACFENSRKFEEWQAMESIAHTKPRSLPCRDCTIGYYSKMVAAGRCAQAKVPGVIKIFGKG
jgi:hypothetical protein